MPGIRPSSFYLVLTNDCESFEYFEGDSDFTVVLYLYELPIGFI